MMTESLDRELPDLAIRRGWTGTSTERSRIADTGQAYLILAGVEAGTGIYDDEFPTRDPNCEPVAETTRSKP